MKSRLDLITNSSSSIFLITNTSDEDKTLVDFVNENQELLDMFIIEYGKYYKDNYELTHENMIKCAIERDEKFPKHRTKLCVFGDEEGDILGYVYDYMLRNDVTYIDTGKTYDNNYSFKWKEVEFIR